MPMIREMFYHHNFENILSVLEMNNTCLLDRMNQPVIKLPTLAAIIPMGILI